MAWIFVGFKFFQRIPLCGLPPGIPVTSSIITFLVGDSYKPSFVTVTAWAKVYQTSLVLLRVTHIVGICPVRDSQMKGNKNNVD